MATADQLDSRCIVEIVGVQLAEPEMPFLLACLGNASRFIHGAEKIFIYCAERKPNGWLEYCISVQYADKRSLTIGALQRTVGAEVEFHS